MTDQSGAETPAIAETKPETTAEADAKEPVKAEAESAPAVPETDAETDKIQSRFDKLTREKYDALREADYWRDRAQRPVEAKPEPVAPAPVPTLETSGFDETKYQAALIAYAKQQAREEAQVVLERESAQRELAVLRGTFEKRQVDYIKSHPDYVDKVLNNPRLPITEDMAQVIMDSEIGPAVAEYLADNESQARAISLLPAIAQAREIGRIEARLEAAKVKPKPPVSQAPPPTPKIDATSPAIEKPMSEWSDNEYNKWRLRQIAQRKGYRSV